MLISTSKVVIVSVVTATVDNHPSHADVLKSMQTPLKDGWGITNDGTSLIVGDSTHTLYYIDPKSMKIKKKIDVTGAMLSFFSWIMVACT